MPAADVLPEWLKKSKEDILRAKEWNTVATSIFRKLHEVLRRHNVEFFNDLTGEEKNLFISQAESELLECSEYKDFTSIVGKVIDAHLEDEIREDVRSAEASISVSDLMVSKAGQAASSLLSFAKDQKWRLTQLLLQRLPQQLRLEVWKMVLVDVKTRIAFDEFALQKQGTSQLARVELEITKRCRHILETEFMELNTGRILAMMKSVIAFHVFSHSDRSQALPAVPDDDPLGHCYYVIIPLLWIYAKSDGRADAAVVAECLEMIVSHPRPIDVGEALSEGMTSVALQKSAAKASAIDFGRAVLTILKEADKELFEGLRRVFVDNILSDETRSAENENEKEHKDEETIPSIFAMRVAHTLEFATSRMFVGAIQDIEAVFFLWDQIILANSDPVTLQLRKVNLDHDDSLFGHIDVLPHICCTLLVLARERLLGSTNQTAVDNSFRNAARHFSVNLVRRTFETKFGNMIRTKLGLPQLTDVRMDVLQHKFKPGLQLPERRPRHLGVEKEVQVEPEEEEKVPDTEARTPSPPSISTSEPVSNIPLIAQARAFVSAAIVLESVARRLIVQSQQKLDVEDAWQSFYDEIDFRKREEEKRKVAQKRVTSSVYLDEVPTICIEPAVSLGPLNVTVDGRYSFLFQTPPLYYRDESIPLFVRKVMALEENRGAIETYLDDITKDLDLPTRKKRRREKRVAANKVAAVLKTAVSKLMPFMDTEGVIFGGFHSDSYRDSDEDVEQIIPSAPEMYIEYAGKRWSYISKGRVLGPASFEEFLEYAREKKVTAVWFPGMEKWVKFKEMPGLQECIDFDPNNVLRREHWLKEVDLAESVPSTPPPAPDGALIIEDNDYDEDELPEPEENLTKAAVTVFRTIRLLLRGPRDVWEEIKKEAQIEKDNVEGIKVINKVKYLGDDVPDEELYTTDKKQYIAYQENLEEAFNKYYAAKAKQYDKERKMNLKEAKKNKKAKKPLAEADAEKE